MYDKNVLDMFPGRGRLQLRGEFEGVEPALGRRPLEPIGSRIPRMQRGLESPPHEKSIRPSTRSRNAMPV